MKKETPQVAMGKEKIKNDSDSEDEDKKNRQRFKSERPKEQQHKMVKHEPSRLKNDFIRFDAETMLRDMQTLNFKTQKSKSSDFQSARNGLKNEALPIFFLQL